jgi:hypothetical protein
MDTCLQHQLVYFLKYPKQIDKDEQIKILMFRNTLLLSNYINNNQLFVSKVEKIDTCDYVVDEDENDEGYKLVLFSLL